MRQVLIGRVVFQFDRSGCLAALEVLHLHRQIFKFGGEPNNCTARRTDTLAPVLDRIKISGFGADGLGTEFFIDRFTQRIALNL